jgi:ribosomal protein S17
LFAEKRKILRLIVQSGFTKKQVVVKRAQKTLHLSTRNLWTR